MVRLIFLFLAMLAATPLGWANPAAAQETSGEYREALNAIHAEMNSLTLEIERFQVSRRYCKPPGTPSKAEAQAELDELARRAEALNQRYNALKQSLKDFAKNPRVAADLMLRDIDPTDERWFSSYEAARRRMADALARKRAALAAAQEVDCTPKPKPKPPVTTGGFQAPSLPVRPSTGSSAMPTLPAHFCSQDEKDKFLRDVIHPLYNKAAEDAERVAEFRTQVEQAVNSYVQNDRRVPPDLIARRRQAIADVEAANRRMRETEALYNRAKAIPVIDCRTPQQDPPAQDTRTGQAPQGTGLINQDLNRMAQQQQSIGEIEGAIAEIDALRKAGRCHEIVELEDQLYRDIGMLGRLVFENPDGSRSRVVPPGVTEELRRKANAAARPCPASPSTETALRLAAPPPGSPAARFLDAHNAARAAFGSPPLQWDPTLAASAHAYAQRMGTVGRVHSTREGRRDVRENLLQSLPGGRSIEQMVGVWIAEQRNFVPGVFPNVSRTGNWADIGHFTQVVWPTTTRVGCAVARGGGFDWTVCHYSPPGNRDGTAIGARQ